MTAAAFALVAILLGAASLFASRPWPRAGAFCFLLTALTGIWWSALGQPRPPWFAKPTGVVVGYSLNEPVAIYLWVRADGAVIPVAWVLPWREQTAAGLMDAANAAKASGRILRVKPTGKQGARKGYGNGQPAFYPAPLAPLPPKATP